MKFGFGALGVAFLLNAGVVSAQEQVWLQDRRFLEGKGYQVGDLELHPGLAGEFGYDSNMFHRASSEDPIDVYRLRITPSLSLATAEAGKRGPEGTRQTVAFNGTVGASYNEYFARDSAEADRVSKFRNVGALARLELDILPNRPWSGRLHANLTRTIQPSNLSDTAYAYNRIHAGGGGELIWAPGGGLFDWRLGYAYQTTIFEESRFESLNSGTHTLRTRGRWRFLPRTAFMFDASQGFTRYSNPGARTYLLDSDPLRARLGLSGLITDRFGLLALAGWGVTFAHSGNVPVENYDGPIGQAQLTFYPTAAPDLTGAPREAMLAVSQIGVGYTRDFADSYFGSFYTRDRGYLTVSYFFAGKLLTSLQGGISRVHFPTLYYPAVAGAPAVQRTGPFNEQRYDASLFAEYRLADSVGVNTTVGYEQNDSRDLPVDPNDPAAVDDLSWQRFQALLGVRWLM